MEPFDEPSNEHAAPTELENDQGALGAIDMALAAARERCVYVSSSLTRRVKRFTTKPTGAWPVARLDGEQAGKEPMGRNEDEPHRMSLVSLYERRRRASGCQVKAAACRQIIARACKLRRGWRGRHVGTKHTDKRGGPNQ